MDWFPVVFFTFKFLVLATGMYFAVRWHYDQVAKHGKGEVLKASSMMAGAFMLTLMAVGLIAFLTSRMLGLDLGFG